MAFYEFNGENTPEARELRQGQDMVAQGIEKCLRARARLNQMSAGQIVNQLTVRADDDNTQSAAQQATALKAEVDSTWGKWAAPSGVSLSDFIAAFLQLNSRI